MKLVKDYLGKVSVTTEGWHDKTKSYDRLCVVNDPRHKVIARSFISRKPVPAGVDLYDETYWMRFSNDVRSISKAFIDACFDDRITVPTTEWDDYSLEDFDTIDGDCCEGIDLALIESTTSVCKDEDSNNSSSSQDSNCDCCDSIDNADILKTFRHG